MKLRNFIILLFVIFVIVILLMVFATYYITGAATPKAVVAGVLS